MYRIIFFALFIFSACAPIYVPNVRNSPMFTKEGEFQAAVQIGNGLEAQSAFAFTEHFGVMANFAFIDQSNLENEEDYHRHQFFEGGAGYFLNNDGSFFEVFAGYGRGKVPATIPMSYSDRSPSLPPEGTSDIFSSLRSDSTAMR